MLKKLVMLILTGFMAINLCGCIAVMAGLAESAKAKQTLNVPYSEAIDIVSGALKTSGIEFEEAVIEKNIAEVKGKYTDDRTVRIFISKVSDSESRISVRVGTNEAGKKDAKEILQVIVDYADLVGKQ